MNTAEKIAVMQAFEDGKKIEYRSDEFCKSWGDCILPSWDWMHCDYRITPKPATLEDRVKAEYGDYDVVMLKEHEESLDLVMNQPGLPLHITAQSMKGFYRFAYIHPDGDFDTSTDAVMSWDKGVTLHPIAALFVRGEG